MGKAKSTFAQKVDWMVRHAILWKGWPDAKYTDNQIIGRMQEDGLISKNSNTYDIMDFGKLITAARDQINKNLHNK